MKRTLSAFALLFAIVTANLLALSVHGTELGTWIASEHGPEEWLQVGLLSVAAWFFWLSYRLPNSPEQAAGEIMAVLCVAAVVRELDARHIPGAPDWLQWLSEHGLKDILFIVMCAPALVILANRRAMIPDIVRLMFRRSAWPMWVAGLFVVAGIVFDTRIVRWYGAQYRFSEELFETNGYGFLIYAAYRHLGLTRLATGFGQSKPDAQPLEAREPMDRFAGADMTAAADGARLARKRAS